MKEVLKMKKTFSFIAVIVLVISMVTMAQAWTVFVDSNTCSVDSWIEVYGEHLFWRQEDCGFGVDAHQTGSCDLPGAICPVYLSLSCHPKGKKFSIYLGKTDIFRGIAACWNVHISLEQNGADACKIVVK